MLLAETSNLAEILNLVIGSIVIALLTWLHRMHYLTDLKIHHVREEVLTDQKMTNACSQIADYAATSAAKLAEVVNETVINKLEQVHQSVNGNYELLVQKVASLEAEIVVLKQKLLDTSK